MVGIEQIIKIRRNKKMAEGDITKEYENDKIEIILTWSIQVRKATKIMEE